MKILGFEKLSLVDFDGHLSCTVFTGGCNFKCDFCHNGPLVLKHDILEEIDEDTVIEYLNKRKGIIDAICISGGEPTLNKDLPLFIQKAKKTGVLVKLDTNGTNPEMIKTLTKEKLVDYFAMDIKNDLENYGRIIGIENFNTVNVEESVDFFLSGHADYEFRTTVIEEYHNINNMIRIGKWIKGAKKYFLQKYIANENCINSQLNQVPYKKILEYLSIVKNYIPDTKLRGYDN